MDLSILNPGTPFSKKSFELIEFYRNNPVIAAEDLLNVELDTPQKVVFEDMWFKPYVLLTEGRGCGKTWKLSVIATLYALLYPGKKVLLMSPSFRQSKNLFSEVMNRHAESSILREASIKKPVIGADNCYLHLRAPANKFGSKIEAYPLGTGEKIRGLRGHLIVVDEFAQVPEEIFEMVIRPMGATTNSPMENVRKIKRLKDSLERGVLSQEQYEEEMGEGQANKIICVSSAYYQFNHMYKRIQAYEAEIAKGNTDKYAVHYVSYRDMSEGFLDMSNVEEAKATMSRIEFNLEYEGIWESDSDGVFKASLIEACKDSRFKVKNKSDMGRKYIVGIDPARSTDAFAVVIIEMGNPSSVVYAHQSVGNKFPAMANFIFDLAKKFDVKIIMMDAGSGGGGVAIKDLLANDQMFKGRELIIDMDDEEYKNADGRRILRMHDPKPKSIAEAVYGSLNLLEQGLLKFPFPPYDGNEEKESIYADIDEMLKQMMLITVTETKTGQAHFDIPSTGKGSRKKDLYSAFVLAAKGLYDEITMREDGGQLLTTGIVTPINRSEYRNIRMSGPRITSIMPFNGR